MRAVVGRPVATQERWNRGDLALPGWGVGNDSEIVSASSQARNVVVTTGNPAHTKGAWVQVTASTQSDWDGIAIWGTSYSTGADSNILVDVGVGAAASEVVIASNLPMGQLQGPLTLGAIELPVRLQAGSRLAIRAQGAQVSSAKTIYLTKYLVSRRSSPAYLESIGTSTSTSAGTTLTAPGATNTKSAWTQLIASTTSPYRGLICCPHYPAGLTIAPTADLMFDVAVGASGSETIVSSNQWVQTTTSEYLAGQRFQSVLAHIPAGSRIAARYQTSSLSQTLAAAVIGIPY